MASTSTPTFITKQKNSSRFLAPLRDAPSRVGEDESQDAHDDEQPERVRQQIGGTIPVRADLAQYDDVYDADPERGE